VEFNMSGSIHSHLSQQQSQLLKNLHKLMQRQGITEAQLARETAIPQPTMHKILSGKTADPRISTLQSIAQYFSMSVDDLFSANCSSKSASSSSTQLVSIIDWNDCDNSSLAKAMQSADAKDAIVITHSSEQLFGLYSLPCMEPRLPKGSVLIVDPSLAPQDGDLVVIAYPNSQSALREISIDGPTKTLLPLNTRSKAAELTDDVRIIGVVIQSRFTYV
jgi:transcriptional regulator with XRE-family HTH domain